MMMIHKRGWTERDEIEILDLTLHSRMNSNVYKIEKGTVSHLEFGKYIFQQRESLLQFKQNLGKNPTFLLFKLFYAPVLT